MTVRKNDASFDTKKCRSRRAVTACNGIGDEKIKFIIKIEEISVCCSCNHWESWQVCYTRREVSNVLRINHSLFPTIFHPSQVT